MAQRRHRRRPRNRSRSNREGDADEIKGIQAVRRRDEDLWLFAYGSLMWRPEFAYEERTHARLNGYHRAFCIYSTHHRGSSDRPGLVLGLDRGQVCEGIAYRIAPRNIDGVVGYLRERELVNGVYREAIVPLTLAGEPRREVRALAYIVERAHPSYAARLPLAEQARLIRAARGRSGNNLDYLVNTARHLADLGIRERWLERLLAMTAAHVARVAGSTLASPRAAALMRAHRHHPINVRLMRPMERRRFLYRTRLTGGT
jgi:glutathione-specific gamma-glutamylcyclotransferase